MWYRLSIAASAVLMMGTITANAAELPTYEVGGFPASPAQIAVLKRHDQKTTDRSGRSTTGLARLSTGN